MKKQIRSKLRNFVREIRTSLTAEGHSDVMFRSAWIRDADGEEPFVIDVPVGPEFVVTLRPELLSYESPKSEDWSKDACTFASALITLHNGETALSSYAEEVRQAVSKEIEKARKQGLDIRLSRVGFSPVDVGSLTDANLRGALDYVVAEAEIETTNSSLEREVETLTLGHPSKASSALKKYLTYQARRQAREDELELIGADLEVSDICLEIIRLTGKSSTTVLSDLLKSRRLSFTPREEIRIDLRIDCGTVKATVVTDSIFWHEDVLHLRENEVTAHPEDLPGKTLSDYITDPIFANLPVKHCAPDEGGSLVFVFDEQRNYFDASAMRIWDKNEERRKAA